MPLVVPLPISHLPMAMRQFEEYPSPAKRFSEPHLMGLQMFDCCDPRDAMFIGRQDQQSAIDSMLAEVNNLIALDAAAMVHRVPRA